MSVGPRVRRGGSGGFAAKTDDPMRSRLAFALPLLVVALVFPAAARASPSTSAGIAALQVALRSHGLYHGTIDGIRGPATTRAIRKLQWHARIAVDGIPGPQTRRALGRFGRHHLGSRRPHAGLAGWDVAALQFELAQHGCAAGRFG